MKKILIALDYDPSAQKIAEAGYDLANSMHARVILLHVISDAMYYSTLDYSPVMGFESFSNVIPTVSSAELTEMAADYLNKSKTHLGDETIQTVIRAGDFGETILNTAAEFNADIIVLGSHSRRGLEKILMGSVAEKVLHHSRVPLFIIPTKTH